MRQKNFLTLKQACKLLQVHPQTIYIWRKKGKFPTAIRLGGRKLLWDETDLLDWIESRSQCSTTVEKSHG